MGVPTFYTRMLQDPRLTREATSHMRLFVSGSAPLLSETHREWQDKTGHAILERYGMTETGMNTSNPYDGDRIAGTVGFPLTDVELRVVDPESGRPLGAERDRHDRGQRAERVQGVLANARKNCRGIQSRLVLHHRRSRSGRRTRICPHRRSRQGPDHYRRLQRLPQRGRERDRFSAWRRGKRGDRRCSPGPRRGRHRNRRRRARRRIDEAAILEHLGKRLARFKLPKRIFIVPELPRNTMGKVQKNMLRETYGALYAKNR